MIKAEDLKLWRDAMAGVIRITPRAVAREPVRGRIPIRDITTKTTIDLHGLTVRDAHAEVTSFVREAAYAGYRHVTVITGLSGQIRAEFTHWMSLLSCVREVKPLNGGGAFKVTFYKKAK